MLTLGAYGILVLFSAILSFKRKPQWLRICLRAFRLAIRRVEAHNFHNLPGLQQLARLAG